MLSELVDNIAKSDREIMDKLLVDGTYDDNIIFPFLSDNGILSDIEVRKNDDKV